MSGSKPGIEGSDPFLDRPDGALTLDQAAALQTWVREVAPLVGLAAWRLFVSTHECSADTSASSSVRVDSDEAWLAVEVGHAEVGERRRRATLTHELLHCHLQPVVQPIVDRLEQTVAPAEFEATKGLLRGPEERMIERLAWAISEYLPPCPNL